MDLDTTGDIVAIAVGITTLVGLVVGAWWKWERPRRLRTEARWTNLEERDKDRGRKLDAVHDVMLGRPAVLDNSGAIAQEGIPGMPAQVKQVDERLTDLKSEVVSLRTDLHGRVTHLETVTVALVQRVTGVEETVKGCPAHAPTTPSVSASLSVTTNPEEPKP